MKPIGLLLLVLLAGCFKIPAYPPCDGKVRVDISYDAVTRNADTLSISMYWLSSSSPYHYPAITRQPGSYSDTLDVKFSSTYWSESITMNIKASQNGVVIGTGSTEVVGTSSCSDAHVTINGPDLGSPQDLF